MFSKGSIRWPWKKELVIPEDDDEFCHVFTLYSYLIYISRWYEKIKSTKK